MKKQPKQWELNDSRRPFLELVGFTALVTFFSLAERKLQSLSYLARGIRNFRYGYNLSSLPYTLRSNSPLIINLDGISDYNDKKAEFTLFMLSEFTAQGIPVTISINPLNQERYLQRSDKLSTGIREAILRNPQMVEYGIYDPVGITAQGNLEEAVEFISKSQFVLAEALRNSLGTPKTYATSLSSEFDISLEYLASLLQGGITTHFYESDMRLPELRRSGYGIFSLPKNRQLTVNQDNLLSIDEIAQNLSNLIEREPGTKVLNLYPEKIEEALGSHGRNYVRELTEGITTMMQRDGIRVLRPVKHHLEKGGKQNIVVRCDDLQYTLETNEVIDVLELLNYEGIPINVAVIPYSSTGNLGDSDYAISYLMEAVAKGYAEVSIKGYDVGSSEFSRIPINQRGILSEYSSYLSRNLIGARINVVVPTTNVISDETSRMIRESRLNDESEIAIISSSPSFDSLVIGYDSFGNYHLSNMVDTIELKANSEGGEFVLRDIEAILLEMDFFDVVLNIHPLLHTTQESKEYLRKLITRLKEKPYVQFVTMNHYLERVSLPK